MKYGWLGGRYRLTDLPAEIAQLRRLHFLDLQGNRFTRVPPALLDLHAFTEINLRDNPLPEAEILAVRHAQIGRAHV